MDMDHELRINLARCATARAHLAGAEATELQRQANNPPEDHPDPEPFQIVLGAQAAAARRRHWREMATAQSLAIG